MRKLLGIIMLVIGLAGIVLSLTGAVVGRRLIAGIGNTLEANLRLTIQSLDAVNESLTLTRQTIREIRTGLETLAVTGERAAGSLEDTRPMVTQISQVLTNDVAGSLETFQERLPDMVEVARSIDDTLTTLSNFRIDRTILGIPLRYDLGVDYDPEVPFADSVEELGASMEGLPEELRVLETHLEVADTNLGEISGDARQLAGDLGRINETVDELAPQLDEFNATLTEFADSARQLRSTLDAQLNTFQTVWVVLMIWLGLTQIAPLYLGYELVRGRR